MVSHAMEDYIAAIWRLTQYGGTASTSEVARKLGVTAASTSYMFKKMAEAGLVEYKEYAGVSLTRSGELAAMNYIRRHRITERFLVEVLGIGWDRADGISDRMEHSLPEEVIDRMEAVMGYPAACPHGYPIPTKEGVLPDLKLRPLAELASGEKGTVRQVAEHDEQLLTYFQEHGIKPGTEVLVLERDQMGETLTLQIPSKSGPFVLGAAIARLVQMDAKEG
jgi:DtxR family transcriptional regulator, Mn-dependent transcriptional regulator